MIKLELWHFFLSFWKDEDKMQEEIVEILFDCTQFWWKTTQKIAGRRFLKIRSSFEFGHRICRLVGTWKPSWSLIGKLHVPDLRSSLSFTRKQSQLENTFAKRPIKLVDMWKPSWSTIICESRPSNYMLIWKFTLRTCEGLDNKTILQNQMMF